MDMRTLRQVRGQKDWESEQWEELKEDMLLNIQDDIVDEKIPRGRDLRVLMRSRAFYA